ncbi:U box domain [Trypanosoma vivax]|uniref:Pre-mRNA-processing factor 19 n=1 Tax=Trypanosoma vivax (strain Y486) TaxID=1055687 RepID=G0TS43_TRYVY|nr:hypothetical protein TRVL_01388 [Trypanosoma vivax]KAH8615890.1 U box domain [Trypanosoma vivax]CCC46767.1 conserved hypothetical protein [Trypanosoma vivax Y486]
MFCCISNRIPHEPVVSRTSGCLYERSLIEKYIEEHARCPVTGEPLRKDDLIAVRATPLSGTTVVNAQVACETIPGMLAKLHSQWDAVMLEQFSLRQQLTQTQQELAHAIHQYEAACRVIATFIKDGGTTGFSHLDAEVEKAGAPPSGGPEDRGGTNALLPESVKRDLSEYDGIQRAKRKTRLPPPSLASEQHIRDMVEEGSIDLGRIPRAVAFAMEGNIFVAFEDAVIACCDVRSSSVKTVGLGHEGAVRHIVTYGAEGNSDLTGNSSLCVVSGSDDATLRLWKCDAETLVCQGIVRQHRSGIVGLSKVVAGHILVSASATDIGLVDITRMDSISSVAASAEGLSGITCLGVHPYGSLAAVGVEGAGFCIWNTSEMCLDTSVSLEVGGSDVCAVAFNADCFTLATGLRSGGALLWDLRKLSCPMYEIQPMDARGASPLPDEVLSTVLFDDYGKYLAVGGRGVRLFDWSTLQERREPLSTLSAGSQLVTDVCWGVDALTLVSCSVDGKLKIYGSA